MLQAMENLQLNVLQLMESLVPVGPVNESHYSVISSSIYSFPISSN